MSFHLVLLETSGNQDFLFRTNMIRDHMGASELTYRAGTRFVLDAIAKATGQPSLWRPDPEQLREQLRDPQANPPIESGNRPAEVIVSTSGKAILTTSSPDLAREIVRLATQTALTAAPGIDLAGCHVPVAIAAAEMHDSKSLAVLADAMSRLYREFERVRAVRTATKARFPVLPIVAPCHTSGSPAATREGLNKTTQVDVSRSSAAKWRHRRFWQDRIRQTLPDIDFPKFEDLEAQLESANWLAVVHADGNGIGRIFMNFDRYLPAGKKTPRGYLDTLRRFSLELEEATEAAFVEAIQVTWPAASDRSKPLIAPLILGGDDLTAVCEGTRAVGFARNYLCAFENETRNANRSTLREMAEQAGDRGPGLYACAGVAVIKSHYPFHSAYRLAEQLLRSAKRAKGDHVSALDFHYLFDSTFADLDEVRKRLRSDNLSTSLTAKPYVVSDDVSHASPWAREHHYDDLVKRVGRLQKEDDDGRPRLPRSQLHDLKEGLYLGHAAADARLRLIQQRYSSQGIDELLEADGSLFRDATAPCSDSADPTDPKDSNKIKRETRFLDALELASMTSEDA